MFKNNYPLFLMLYYEKMNIGFDAKRLYNNFTGLGNYSRTLLVNLQKFYPENKYTLYTPRITHSPETDFFYNHEKIKTFVPHTGSSSYWRSISILKQLQKDEIELYHGLSHEIPINIYKSGIKSIVTIHDLIFKVYPGTYSFTDRYIYNSKFRYSCKNSDHIIAVSESTKWDIVNYFNIDPLKIEVIYQSCSNMFGTRKTDEEIKKTLKQYKIPKKYILYVGSVIERKNLITLVDSLASLNKDLKIPLVVIGKGKKYKNRVQERARKLKVDKHIIWIDYMDNNDDLQVMYQQASLFIYPSLYEGFGIPVIEAMINKTPVITSNTSSLPEAGGPAAWYIDPLSSEQITYGIEKILSDSEERITMTETGYQYVCKTFNDKVITDKLQQLYHRIIEK